MSTVRVPDGEAFNCAQYDVQVVSTAVSFSESLARRFVFQRSAMIVLDGFGPSTGLSLASQRIRA